MPFFRFQDARLAVCNFEKFLHAFENIFTEVFKGEMTSCSIHDILRRFKLLPDTFVKCKEQLTIVRTKLDGVGESRGCYFSP